MSRSRKLGAGLAFLALIAVVAALLARGRAEPRVEETRDANQASQKRFFEAHLTRLERKGDRVEGAADARLLGASGTWSVGFVLRALDDHGTTTYTLSGVQDDGAAIAYEARFDHRSFGKDLVTVDRGAFVVPWKR